MRGLNTKVVLITGGATGIGLATARRLLQEGADVILTGHRAEQLEEASAQLEDGTGTLILEIVDVRDSSALVAAVTRAEGRFGRLDGLVSAAGIQIPGSAATATQDDWDNILDVNLTGAFRACKAVLPAMTRAGGGAIVLISSVQALRGKRNGIAYVTAKGGLNAMMRALAIDHAGDNVRANAICPGVVDTPLLRAAAAQGGGGQDIEKLVRDWSDAQPLTAGIGRVCTPDDVAALAAFLLSDDAAYVTGSEYGIDGGLAAKLAI